ncbi:MAG: serine protease [Methyloceanibacter sp.]
MNSPSPEAISSSSPVRKALIYAKEGSTKLIDGRWNLSQSEAKLGLAFSAGETKQLMACTGQIECWTPDVHNEVEDRVGIKITASAVSVLRPDLLVTARHVLFKGKRALASFGRCSFRSFAKRKAAIPVVVEKDQRKGYVFNNEDFVVLRLKRELEGCDGFAIDASDALLREDDEVASVTARQRQTLNKLSDREPVVATGKIRRVLEGVLGGPPFYYADFDFDEGGSGGAVFAVKDGRPVADEDGRLVLRGISVAFGPNARNGKPYSDDRNYTIVVGLQAEFRDLVAGKAQKAATVEPAACPGGEAAKIDVISDPVPSAEPEAPSLRQHACSGKTKPGRKAGKANADCKTIANGLKLAAQRGKEKRAYTWKNGTSCRICFTYNRCNTYGCWDQAVRLSARSTLLAGTGERAPAIQKPQFCK